MARPGLWGSPKTSERARTKTWGDPKSWNREAAAAGTRYRVFGGSLMDWAEDHPALDAWRVDMWQLIRETPNLDWLMLTKRMELVPRLLPKDWGDGYPNVWLGTSIEDMRVAGRVDHLRRIPAVVRFVSYEPALGSLDAMELRGVDWMIYGGESGRNWRPDRDEWARNMRDRCGAAGIAFYFKQTAAAIQGTRPTLDGVRHFNYPVPRRVELPATYQGQGSLF